MSGLWIESGPARSGGVHSSQTSPRPTRVTRSTASSRGQRATRESAFRQGTLTTWRVVVPARLLYCTLAITDAAALIVRVHVFVLRPPLEQAPDQIASRPLETDSVTDVPLENEAEPALPTGTLMPAGLERIVLPDRPVAVTVSVTVGPGG